MRRLAGVLLAGCLLGSVMLAACSALDPGPSPSPERLTDRVELAEHGVALNLPGEWWAQHLPPLEDLEPPPTQERVLYAESEHGPGYCELWIDPAAGESSTSLTAYTEELIRAYESSPSVSGTSEPVELTAGPAMRVRIVDGEVNPLAHTEYVLQREGVVYRLACSVFDPRQDDWLSMAEGIEFMALED